MNSILQQGLVVPALLVVLLIVAPPASAHGYLVRAIPDDRAALERAPARLQYWFSESLEAEYSSLAVLDQSRQVVASGGVNEENPTLMSARLPRDLPDGAYLVEMRVAFASDGHVVTETRTFFVGEAVAGTAGGSGSSEANLLEVIWRAVSLSSILLLFGVFTLYSGVLVPAWGNASYRAGLLPPRLMRRLSAVIAGALVSAFSGGILAILQQAMVFFNTDLGTVISQNLWSIVRGSSRFGELWTARMFLLALVAAAYGLSLYWRREQPETVRPFWTANAWAMALVIATFSAGSHAAGSLLWPWAGVMIDWLHALAVGFWAGGLGALTLVLPVALGPYQGETRRLALLAALRRFSRVATACVVMVVSTGIYSSLNWIYTPGDLTQTSFGQSLLFKLLLAGGLLLVGFAHHIAVRPERYQRWEALIRRLNGFIPTLRLETALALVVISATGLLSATPVPVPDFVKNSVPPPSETIQAGEYGVTMTITPGGPGVNTVDTVITRNGQPTDEAEVRVRFVNPSRDWRSAWEAAENAGAGLYVAAGDALDRAGGWWSLVDIRDPDEKVTRAAFDWLIREEAAIIQSRAPGIVNVLALAGVLGAIGWVLYPPARRVYQRLDLRPATVTAAIGVVIMTALFTVVGIVAVQNSQAQYEATLNPLPTVINTVLPDAASLERGQQLYAEHCAAGWEAARDFPALVERLPRTRDDELFAATRDGWRSLPACTGGLSDKQRWDVVNYFRTKEPDK